MVVRYMGTKRHMVDTVRDRILDASPESKVVDLFAGMGSVAESLVGERFVVTNDAMSFAASIARARFTGTEKVSTPRAAISRLQARYLQQRDFLRAGFANQLATEEAALDGDRHVLLRHIEHAAHVGNSPERRRAALASAVSSEREHYALATLYFSTGYLSLAQAIEVDAIRAAARC